MTRKHFIALAKALKENNASRQLIEDIGNICCSTNYNFDRERFRCASGFYDKEKMLKEKVYS